MSKFKKYQEFFKDVEAEGEFVCYDYPEDVKRSIVGDFEPVLEGETNEPLKCALEDILATAQLREVRVFPKNEFMYVRAEVKFIDADGEWGEPYQILALWDCFNVLKSYTFVRGEERTEVYPTELEGCESRVQKDVRAELQIKRVAASHDDVAR